MKRSFITSGVILAASFTLTNCALEIVDSDENFNEGIPFEICAGSVDTKTTLDGLATKWASGDAINLFHAATGTEEYVSDGSFTIADADLESGRFTGTLASALEDDAYDWYAFYPYSSYNKTPAGVSQDTFGYTTIGGTSQTQSGNDSMTHLCGKACPLYGIVKDVSVDETPSIKMNHLTSIIEIKVTNNSGNPLTVSSVTFTAPEDIVGTYYINFASTPVAYTEATYATSTAALTVKNAEAIANGASATFYIAVKPFEAVAGDDLKIKVNGYEKSVTVPDGESVEFSAGKIKTLNFNYNYVVDPDSPIWDLTMDSTSEASTDKIAWTSNWADMVCEKSASTSDANNYYPGVGQSSTRFYTNSVLTITPKAGKAITYYTFTATTSGYATALENSAWTNVKASNATASEPFVVTIVPKDPASPVSAVMSGTTGLTKVEIHTDTAPVFAPIINASVTSMSVAAEGGLSEITYTIKNPVDGKSISASSDQDWISGFDYSTEGKVAFAFEENTGEARSASITLSYEGADDVNLTVNQDAPGTKEYKYIFNSKSWTATLGEIDANWVGSADGNQFNSSASPIGVQVTAAVSGVSGVTVKSPISFTNVSKVVVNYSSTSKGVGSIAVAVGETTIASKDISKSQSKVDFDYIPSSPLSGTITLTCTCTTNSLAIVSVTVYAE